MLTLTAIRAIPWRWIGLGLALLAIVTTIALHFRNDGKTRDALKSALEWQGTVIEATRVASGNPKVRADTTPGQIVAMGQSIHDLKASVALQNEAIDDLARREVAAKAEAKRLTEIARKAEAQRASALRRLSDLSLTPGTRGDCLTLLAEAETALDLAYGALKERGT